MLTKIIAIDETVVGTFNRKKREYKGVNRYNPDHQTKSEVQTSKKSKIEVENIQKDLNDKSQIIDSNVVFFFFKIINIRELRLHLD